MIRPTDAVRNQNVVYTTPAPRPSDAPLPTDVAHISGRPHPNGKVSHARDEKPDWRASLGKLKAHMETAASLGVGGPQAGVAVTVDNWTSKGPLSDIQAIADRAMSEKGLATRFSDAVLGEVNAIKGAAPLPTDGSIKDLRSLPWSSIDNGDLDAATGKLVNASMDLDQIEMAEKLPDGSIKIRVAIADVDSLAPRGSAIDQHAMLNTRTVYTDDKIYAMLPERLSTDLTSLGPDVDRLAMVKEYVVAPDGSITSEDLYRAMVHNYAKMAYNSVGAWLEGKGAPPPPIRDNPVIAEQVRLQDEAAQRLKTHRFSDGALSLEGRESRVHDNGTVLALEMHQANRATELIENLMVASNGVTNRGVSGRGYPSLRRIVKTPEKWDQIVALAKEKGETLPSNPDSGKLNEFLVKQRKADPLRFPDLSLSIVKLLGRGEYVVDVPGQDTPGHFCLAVSAYAHSTAPNRRGPDLVEQRIEKAALAGQPCPYSDEELQTLADHFTQREDDVNKVERRVHKSAVAKFLEPQIGKIFDGLITGSGDKGTWVRVVDPPVEGKVTHGGFKSKVGDQVKVKLTDVNVDKGFIDFAAVPTA